MGCDIHLHVEVKIKGKWHHYNHPYINRDYRLFSKMAGVRSNYDDVPPIAQPRGIPTDASTTTKFECEHDGIDGHSHSWLSASEAGEAQEWYEKLFPDKHFHPPIFGYLFGNSIDSHIRYPDDAKSLQSIGFQDARIVFWFDN